MRNAEPHVGPGSNDRTSQDPNEDRENWLIFTGMLLYKWEGIYFLDVFVGQSCPSKEAVPLAQDQRVIQK